MEGKGSKDLSHIRFNSAFISIKARINLDVFSNSKATSACLSDTSPRSNVVSESIKLSITFSHQEFQRS